MGLPLHVLSVVGLLAVGVPPRVTTDQEPLSTFDSIVLVGILILAFWWSVRFVAWIDAKIEARELVREIYRELRQHRPKPRKPGDPERRD